MKIKDAKIISNRLIGKLWKLKFSGKVGKMLISEYLPLPAFRKVKNSTKIMKAEVSQFIQLRKNHVATQSEPTDLISVMLNS